jgi:hypothetical protein
VDKNSRAGAGCQETAVAPSWLCHRSGSKKRQSQRLLRQRLLNGEPLDLIEVEAEIEVNPAPTLAAFLRRFMANSAKAENKPSELRSKTTVFKLHLVPYFAP